MPSSPVNPDDSVSLKEFFETLLKERDLYYTEKIKYLETRIVSVDDKHSAAVSAVKEVSAATSAASEKAILKAEDAQKELNIKNNEFRGQLKDQASLFISNAEARLQFTNFDDKLNLMRGDFERRIEHLSKIDSERSGKSAGMQTSWAMLIAVIGIIGTIVSIIVAASVLLRR